jgi:hypothetical protein
MRGYRNAMLRDVGCVGDRGRSGEAVGGGLSSLACRGLSMPIPTHERRGEGQSRMHWATEAMKRGNSQDSLIERSRGGRAERRRFSGHRRSCCWGDEGLASRLSVALSPGRRPRFAAPRSGRENKMDQGYMLRSYRATKVHPHRTAPGRLWQRAGIRPADPNLALAAESGRGLPWEMVLQRQGSFSCCPYVVRMTRSTSINVYYFGFCTWVCPCYSPVLSRKYRGFVARLLLAHPPARICLGIFHAK